MGELDKLIPLERYRLVLFHEYIDGEGEIHKIGEPICVTHVAVKDLYSASPMIINKMMEELRRNENGLIYRRHGDAERGELDYSPDFP